jgi:hypothetical protein
MKPKRPEFPPRSAFAPPHPEPGEFSHGLLELCSVRGERLDHTTIADPAMAALLHHTSQLGTKRREQSNAPIDLFEMTPGDAISVGARLFWPLAHRQQFPNGLHLEAKLASVTDKVEANDLRRRVASLPPFTARWRGQEPYLLIVADRRHLYACTARQFSDQNVHGSLLNL